MFIPRLKGDNRSIENVETNEKVPEDEDALHRWAKVSPNLAPLDRACRWSLLTLTPPEEGKRRVVAISIQGLVEGGGLRLEALGNWDHK